MKSKIAFGCNCGINSPPILLKRKMTNSKKYTVIDTTNQYFILWLFVIMVDTFFAKNPSFYPKWFFCALFLVKTKHTSLVYKLSDKINAPNMAKPTVIAIGLNILPSIPLM
jgi:hypothetical protein